MYIYYVLTSDTETLNKQQTHTFSCYLTMAVFFFSFLNVPSSYLKI